METVILCKNCGTTIHFAVGRGSKPSGETWRHVESGAAVCPGTFRATPDVEVEVVKPKAANPNLGLFVFDAETFKKNFRNALREAGF